MSCKPLFVLEEGWNSPPPHCVCDSQRTTYDILHSSRVLLTDINKMAM